MSKLKMNNTLVENSSLLRNSGNYNKDLLTNDYRKTGVKTNSPLNALTIFHVTQNLYSDFMHDCLEGCVKFGLLESLKYFILKKIFFNQCLNDKINTFEHGSIELRSKPPGNI